MLVLAAHIVAIKHKLSPVWNIYLTYIDINISFEMLDWKALGVFIDKYQ